MRIPSIFFIGVISEKVHLLMRHSIVLSSLLITMVILIPGKAFPLFGFSEEEKKPKESASVIPPEYQDKQMPNGWLTDPQVLAEGKAIYEGKTNPKIKCALCHGENGTPTRIGRDRKSVV